MKKGATTISGGMRTGKAKPRRIRTRWLHPTMALLMTVIVVAGFWATYFGPLFQGTVIKPRVIHLHAAVSMGWMALLAVQVTLVSMGRTRVHRKVGMAGFAYGLLVLLIGIMASFVAPILHVSAGDWDMNQAASFLLFPLGDMVLFGGFLGAAMRYRRKPEVHRRLILLTTLALIYPGAARLGLEAAWIFLLVWLSPLILAMLYDLWVRRRVHAVYLIGIAVLLLGYFARVSIAQTESWRRIGRSMLSAFM